MMESLLELYEELAELCRRQAHFVATEDMAGLTAILDEKDILLRAIAVALPQAAAGEGGALRERVLEAAAAAAAAEAAAVQGLSAGLDGLRGRLRQAGEGRTALRSYRPAGQLSRRVDHYSA